MVEPKTEGGVRQIPMIEEASLEADRISKTKLQKISKKKALGM